MTTTPDLGIPELAQAQANPDITHNEALVRLQALLNGVIDKDLSAPPGAPVEGDSYLINTAAPTGAWSGYPYRIAIYWGNAWRFVPGNDDAGSPIAMGARQEGLRIWVRDENLSYTWRNSTGSPASYHWTADPGTGVLPLSALAPAAAQYDVMGRKSIGAGDWEDCTRLQLNIPGLELPNAFTGYNTVSILRAGVDNQGIGAPNGSAVVPFVVTASGSNNVNVGIQSDTGNNILIMSRCGSDASPAVGRMLKSRGVYGTFASVVQNDIAFRFEAQVNTLAGATNNALTISRNDSRIVAAVPSTTDLESRWDVQLCGAGSAAVTSVMALQHATGLNMYGLNVVVDNNRILRPRSYTIATLPTVTTTGVIHVADLGGGQGIAQSNGSQWMRGKETGVATISVDASNTFTWQPLTNAPSIVSTATLTADRTVTLGTTGVYNGCRIRFTRTGAGGFNWIIGGLKNLATNTWCEVEYNGSAWVLMAYGAL